MWAATQDLAASSGVYSICKYNTSTDPYEPRKQIVCTYILNDMLNYSIGLVGAYVRMKKPIRIN